MRRKQGVGRGRTKETRAIYRAVADAGGTVEITGKGHLKITGPDGRVAYVASDPANNAMRTTLKEIERRAGLKLEL